MLEGGDERRGVSRLGRHDRAPDRRPASLRGRRYRASADVLRADVSLRISKVALFFSDLTASTQLYSTVGDASAFVKIMVRDGVMIRLTLLRPT